MDPTEEPVAGKTKVRKRYDIPKTAKCHVCGRFNNIFTLLQFSLAYRVTQKKTDSNRFEKQECCSMHTDLNLEG